MDFFQVPPEAISPLWPVLRPRILSGVERSNGRLSEHAALELLSSGRWQCWGAFEDRDNRAVLVTEIIVYPSGSKGLNGIIAAGEDRGGWQDMAIDTLERFARAEGCILFEMWARMGWEPLMKSKGFKRTHVLLEKTL